MLHRHVEALLYHGVLVGDVSTGAYLHVGGRLVYVAILALIFEAPLAGVEDHCILEMAVPWLAEGARPCWACRVRTLNCEILVFARPWDVELQALTVKGLVGVEPW
jgi:hypothetical protein